MPRTIFWVSVNGSDITSSLDPILISLTITDSDGGKSDQLEIELDDEGGFIALPPTNAPIEAGIASVGDDGELSSVPVMFEGKVDKISSRGARGGGMTLSISAKSADVKGKPKAHQYKHKDAGKFSEAAKSFGQDAGFTVEVASGIDVERDYWSMQGESFLNWGARHARELGATFKVRGSKAIFAERSAGQSASGQALATIQATNPGNVISWDMSPADDRQEWSKFRVPWYDKAKAKWMVADQDAQARDDGSVEHFHRFTHHNEDAAKARGKSNSAESDRDRGGGTVTIDGDGAAQSEAPCVASGIRPGIDGLYRIKTATHKLVRGAGWTTDLDLKQPSGDAGTDSR